MIQLLTGGVAARIAGVGLMPISLTTGVYRNRLSYTLVPESEEDPLSLSRRMVRAARGLTMDQLPRGGGREGQDRVAGLPFVRV